MNKQATVLNITKEFINTSDLPLEKKTKYLACLDQLAQGKYDDAETIAELDGYLDTVFTSMEDSAIAAEDTEQINMLADLRNARLELQKELLGIAEAPPESPAPPPVATAS